MHLFYKFPAVALTVAALGAVTIPSPASAADPSPPQMNAMCPVMPEMAASPQHFIEHDGRRVYFCCPRCAPKFEQNPAAYAANLQEESDPTPASDTTDSKPSELTNTTCPVMEGEPVDPDIFIEHEGRRVYLCCDLCVDRFEANPDRYAEELARVMPASGPVSDSEDDPAQGDDNADHDESAAAHDTGDHSGHGHADDGRETEAEPAAGTGQTTNAAVSDDEHDHSTHEHGETANPLLQFVHWLGKFHPPAVAFPIALLAAAGVAELLFMASKRPIFDHASRFCVWFGIGMTVAGGILGWFFAGFRLTDPTWLLTTHRWLGTTATLWALLLIVPVAQAWGGESDPRWRIGYRLALFVAILLVGTNAFFGGAMIYGLDHYQWPS